MTNANEETYPALQRLSLAQLDAVFEVVAQTMKASKATRKDTGRPYPLKTTRAERDAVRRALGTLAARGEK